MSDSGPCNADDITHKAGWRTSEFYVTALTAMLPVLTAVFHRDFTDSQVQSWAVIAAGVATTGYGVSRAYGKKAVANAKASVHVACSENVTAMPVAGTGTVAAIPLDTLASILAKLDQIEAAENRRTGSSI